MENMNPAKDRPIGHVSKPTGEQHGSGTTSDLEQAPINIPDDPTISPNMAHLAPRDPKYSPINILKRTKGRTVSVAGPMVRYLKLPFRETCRFFNVDIVYTPMILAREFVRNGVARNLDFTTNRNDQCVVVQVGVSNVEDLLKFCAMMHPYVDGIGLNCGCPIRDQVREGIGAALMSKPDLVASMVKAVKQEYGDRLCIETKIRIHPDLDETVAFVKKVEAAGVDYITVHGRTKNTRSLQPADFDAIKLVKESVSVPVVANGDCFDAAAFKHIAEYTGVDGVMSARGVLANPALFAGYDTCPWSAIEVFMDLAMSCGLTFRLVQHHLLQMMETMMVHRWVSQLNELNNLAEVVDWLDTHFVFKRREDEGFATAVAPPWRHSPDLPPRRPPGKRSEKSSVVKNDESKQGSLKKQDLVSVQSNGLLSYIMRLIATARGWFSRLLRIIMTLLGRRHN